MGPKGLLKGKTRILATNAITVLREADFVCLLRDQRILEKGTYDQLMAMKGEIASLMKASSTDEADSSSPSGTSKLSDETDDSLIAVENGDDYQDEAAEEAQATIGSLEAIRPGTAVSRMRSFNSLRRASTASFSGPRGKATDEEDAGLKSKQSKETSEQGKVKWNVYGEYAKTSNLYAVAIYLVALVAAQTAQVGGSFWLKQWSEINEQMQGNPQVGKYIGVYFAFGIGSAGLVVLQTLILWIFCSIEVCLTPARALCSLKADPRFSAGFPKVT